MKKHIEVKFPLIFIIVLIALIIWTGCNYNSEPVKLQVAAIYVQPGDTLWDIAGEHCPHNMDIRRWIDQVEKLNGIENSDIFEGDKINIFISN